MRRSRKKRHSLFSAILLELATLAVIVAVAQPAWLTGLSHSVESLRRPPPVGEVEFPMEADIQPSATAWNAYAGLPHPIPPRYPGEYPRSAAADRYYSWPERSALR